MHSSLSIFLKCPPICCHLFPTCSIPSFFSMAPIHFEQLPTLRQHALVTLFRSCCYSSNPPVPLERSAPKFPMPRSVWSGLLLFLTNKLSKTELATLNPKPRSTACTVSQMLNPSGGWPLCRSHSSSSLLVFENSRVTFEKAAARAQRLRNPCESRPCSSSSVLAPCCRLSAASQTP